MTYLNAKKYILSLPLEKSEPVAGTRIRALLTELGSPERNIKYLCLTGSNGKSICAELLLSVLSRSPYKVGYLATPSAEEPRESVLIGNTPLSIETTAALTDQIRQAARVAEANEKEPVAEGTFIPTRSEFFLCLGLLAFRESGCRFCLMESDPVGVDTTRFLPAPFGAVICGTIPHSDRRQIQGIRSCLRHGIQEIVSAPQDRKAYTVISDTSAAIHCRLTIPARSEIRPIRLTLRSTEFSYRDKSYRLGLCGRFQITNATVVLETLEMLRRMGYPVTEEQISLGFSHAQIPCKFEVLSVSPTIIADSTHASEAIETVCESMAEFRQMIGSRVRLCLPDGNLASEYDQILRAMDYTRTKTLLLSDRSETDSLEGIFRFAKKKEFLKAALSELDSDEILLISGPHAFTAEIRYELLKILGY